MAKKSLGVEFLAKYWNLNQDEILTIGDQNNDIELLKAGGVKVAMGNATPELKECATFITDTVENDGFVKAMWCGDRACEDQIKEKLSVTSRCMPFEQEHIADTCVCCGKPAKKMVYWGRAY